jgi:peptide-methionine (S)-S-oxide reductase
MRPMKKLMTPVTLALGLTLAAAPAISAGRMATAVFAGGCFWSMQHDMEHIPGVVSTQVGYSGGTVPNPTYDQVSYDRNTGHYESIKITYDPAKISYAQLVAKYFHTTDPTDPNGAFCDKGPEYRPVIFVANEQERKAAEAAKAKAQADLKQKVVTQILPAKPFYAAEEYHQHYPEKNPVAYMTYREGCGKDRRIKQLWG